MLSARVGSLPTLKKVIPANELAVSLETVKKHLRIDLINTDEDTLLEGLIRAATEYVESYCRISIIETRWRLSLPSFPMGGQPIELPVRPLVEMENDLPDDAVPLFVGAKGNVPDTFLRVGVKTTSDPLFSPVINYHLVDGSIVQVLKPATGVFLHHDGNPPTVTPYGLGAFWPEVDLARSYPVSVEWTAGFGKDAESTPHNLKVAICLLVGHYYLNRETTSTTAGMPIPYGVSTLLMLHESGELV